MKFAVTSPLFIHSIHCITRTSNGQGVCLNGNSASTAIDTRNVSKSQLEFLDYLKFHGLEQLSESLKLIHDLALYHSDVSFNEDEESALFDLKILWEGFERIGQES
ncbi:hypothetical protein [Roseivirga thermotolerans]|uniref:Uncharacterized protein n=1 Tax=Roseivirga thermotolerans TaxID=1758176 RepID=A0ABQ3I6S7_9BACT|nr:hypothetical protein [Roseivirga thermotolerans]GHE62503.1 hypothetical protein GCM10011340_17180 [Roseivirga thermotolerans]